MKTPGNAKGGKRGKKKRPSAAQLHSRLSLADTSYGWSELTEEERLAWTLPPRRNAPIPGAASVV